ncbi:MAG: 2-dehydropantoate 2-reductase, partial [Acidobacteria bacterium]
MVQDGRPGRARRARLSHAHRSVEGADQSRRREDRAAGNRLRAARASRRGRSRGIRHSACDLGRRGRGRCGPAASLQRLPHADRGRSRRALPRAARRLQAPETHSHRRPNSTHDDRQDPAPGRRSRVHAADIVRIVIVGAGAIGACIGARLCRARADVALVARGAHLRAMLERGLSVRSPGGDFTVRPEATDDLGALGPADVVLLAVKAHSLPSVAPHLDPLLGPDTAVVSMQNGLPWWYFQQTSGRFDGLTLDRVDPGGVVARAIAPQRVVGAIVYWSAEVVAPGVICHQEGDRITIGEPDGSRSDRTRRIAEVLIAAGFRCRTTTRIRREIWVKLLGNVA